MATNTFQPLTGNSTTAKIGGMASTSPAQNMVNKGQFKKGKPSWNKGKSGVLSKETIQKMKDARKDKPSNALGKHWKIKDTSKMHHKSWNKGKKLTIKQRINQNLSGLKLGHGWNKGKSAIWAIGNKYNSGKKRPEQTGEKSHFWKGGITPINMKIRMSLEYRQWRSNVFTRDEWTCQTCGIKGGKLTVHHIKSFSKYPELRFELLNGITLCRECHKLTDNYAGKAVKNESN